MRIMLCSITLALMASLSGAEAARRSKKRSPENKNRISVSAGFYHVDGFESRPDLFFAYQRQIAADWYLAAGLGFTRLGVSQTEKFVAAAFQSSFHEDNSKVVFYDLGVGYRFLATRKYQAMLVAGAGMLRAAKNSLTMHTGLGLHRKVSQNASLFLDSRLYVYRSNLYQSQLAPTTAEAETSSLTDAEEARHSFTAINLMFNVGLAYGF